MTADDLGTTGELSAAQATALATIAARRHELSGWCATIFDFGETAWREYRSAEWYVARLRAEGFTVEEGSAGMPTAFCAEWSNGEGPVIGLYAEYDGIPGNCQAASTRREPRAGLGFQAGGQSKAVIYVFNTGEALQKFKASNGWTAGADATVAVGKIGANGSVDTETMKQAVSSFILTNVGLEAGASVGAAKVTRISL